ncbi:hypothetical protein BJ508DRAFT_43954 [Ascobolus immersus RN42]|uniref:Uncharacterized protein n=1 Tax=Ascobolus immersus RN42 TaxID=1160509 RepID=A0A3N4HL70_ASCIM|nr:hypothetical protein BJ508DRAFT_43954 [Ascobolus immersus RN42]
MAKRQTSFRSIPRPEAKPSPTTPSRKWNMGYPFLISSPHFAANKTLTQSFKHQQQILPYHKNGKQMALCHRSRLAQSEVQHQHECFVRWSS